MNEPRSAWRTFVTRAVDVLYPRRCVACGRFGPLLCVPCEARMQPATGAGRCPNCSARWGAALNCPRCLGWQALDGVSAAFEMEGAARRLVHGLKYRRVRELAPVMAAHMVKLPAVRPFDVAFAVPLHPSRLRDRGFNQAEMLLRELGWPAAPGTLRRVRKTRTQVGQAVRERRANVSGAFAYEGPPLDGLTVAVVDDVVTTGATAEACAEELRAAGARSVVAIGFARASYDPASSAPPRD
ncbi:MAG: double zinc ribbon domain-containing protein [Dehalococcoidia bacterium]|nr:double zinc ribbon domain-containing protein [Dehalococcoidia bacterium]